MIIQKKCSLHSSRRPARDFILIHFATLKINCLLTTIGWCGGSSRKNASNIFIHSKFASSLLSDFVEWKRKNPSIEFSFSTACGLVEREIFCFQLKHFTKKSYIINGAFINIDWWVSLGICCFQSTRASVWNAARFFTSNFQARRYFRVLGKRGKIRLRCYVSRCKCERSEVKAARECRQRTR